MHTYTNDRCQKCGACCKIWSCWLPPNEVWRFIHLAGIKITSVSDPDKHGFSRVVFDYPCKFLQEEKGLFSCSIYDKAYRPDCCKDYPRSFFNYLKEDPFIFSQEATTCPILQSMVPEQNKTEQE